MTKAPTHDTVRKSCERVRNCAINQPPLDSGKTSIADERLGAIWRGSYLQCLKGSDGAGLAPVLLNRPAAQLSASPSCVDKTQGGGKSNEKAKINSNCLGNSDNAVGRWLRAKGRRR